MWLTIFIVENKNRDIFPRFSYVGNAYEWLALKVMLHIVGWQAQQ